MLSFSINKSYNFTTLAPVILGADYKDMKVKSVMSVEEAVKYRDVHTLHVTIKNAVTGLPDKVSDLTYVLFEQNDVDKTKLLLAVEYIDPYSIVEVSTTNIRINIYNQDTTVLAVIRNSLLELGITNFDTSTF